MTRTAPWNIDPADNDVTNRRRLRLLRNSESCPSPEFRAQNDAIGPRLRGGVGRVYVYTGSLMHPEAFTGTSRPSLRFQANSSHSDGI